MSGNITANTTLTLPVLITGNNTGKATSKVTTQTINYASVLILGAIVIIENALVCLAFTAYSKLRKKQSNILICSQAAIDLLVGLAFIPWKIATLYTKQHLHIGYIVFYILFVSLGNLSSLALDRYLALIKPLKHHTMMDVSRTKKIVLMTWLVPLFLTMIPMTWYTAPPHTRRIAMKIYIGIFWGIMMLIWVIMIAIYIIIYRTASRTIRLRQKRMKAAEHPKESRVKTTKKELRVAHLFGLLLFFFILAYLPILYINLVGLLGYGESLIKPFFHHISLYFLITNSVVNPILCLLLKKDYQLIVKRWICCEWLKEKRTDLDLFGLDAKKGLFALERDNQERRCSHANRATKKANSNGNLLQNCIQE